MRIPDVPDVPLMIKAMIPRCRFVFGWHVWLAWRIFRGEFTMDVIDALEHLGETACWEDMPASVTGLPVSLIARSPSAEGAALACDFALLRALEGERLHVNIAPAEEEEEGDEEAPQEEGMSPLNGSLAG